jgi:hypothetical protein
VRVFPRILALNDLNRLVTRPVGAEPLVVIAGSGPTIAGSTSLRPSWGSALTHHPHVHMIVPGGGISLDGMRWVSCRPGFFLPVRVLS